MRMKKDIYLLSTEDDNKHYTSIIYAIIKFKQSYTAVGSAITINKNVTY